MSTRPAGIGSHKGARVRRNPTLASKKGEVHKKSVAEPYLSVLLPAYDEEATLDVVIDGVLESSENLEIILVDDGSRDGTWEIMQRRADGDRARAYRHATNQGKGAAVRTALEHARGQVVLIQDADLEYSPSDYPRLLQPLKGGRTDVVYGSRAFGSHTAYSFWYVVGNRLVTLATNMLYNCYISDMETGYKVMRREIACSLQLEARGFEIESEITGKLLRLGHRIFEVPIEYAARSREEGKKLVAVDGLKALVALVRYRWWTPADPAGRKLQGP